MRGRPLAPLTLDDADQETLERWVKRPKTAQALAMRGPASSFGPPREPQILRLPTKWGSPNRPWANGASASWGGGRGRGRGRAVGRAQTWSSPHDRG